MILGRNTCGIIKVKTKTIKSTQAVEYIDKSTHKNNRAGPLEPELYLLTTIQPLQYTNLLDMEGVFNYIFKPPKYR